MRGTSTTLKRGAKCKSIKLVHGVGDGHSVECRINSGEKKVRFGGSFVVLLHDTIPGWL